MKKFVLITVLLLATFAVGQEPATAVNQCRADANTWLSQLSVDRSTMQLGVVEIGQRIRMMGNCGDVDPIKISEYNTVGSVYVLGLLFRHVNFMSRHQLIDQFKAEDDAGLR